jgi:hypothetical protein
MLPHGSNRPPLTGENTHAANRIKPDNATIRGNLYRAAKKGTVRKNCRQGNL